MTDEGRITQLRADVDTLTALKARLDPSDAEAVNRVAHNIEKFTKLVVDRDAGPTTEARSAVTKAHGDLANVKAENEKLLADNKARRNAMATMEQDIQQAQTIINRQAVAIKTLQDKLEEAKGIIAKLKEPAVDG